MIRIKIAICTLHLLPRPDPHIKLASFQTPVDVAAMASKGRQPAAEELVSPWRAAKPRRPLRDIPAPDTPEPVRTDSPPNSCNKESTRLGSGVRGSPGSQLDLSEGASPGFPHSQVYRHAGELH